MQSLLDWLKANEKAAAILLAAIMAIGAALSWMVRAVWAAVWRVLEWQKHQRADAARHSRLDPSPAPVVPEADRQPGDPVEAYLEALRTTHSTLPGLFSEHVTDLDTVFIELDVSCGRDGSECPDARSATKGLHVPRTFRELMKEPRNDKQHANRWVVLGDPGAGKSTLARQLTYEQAGRRKGPLPVYASLPRLAMEQKHPFELAEMDAAAAVGSLRSKGLASELFARSENPNSVWLLLDGFDEVTVECREWVSEQLRQWAERLSNVTIALLSRPVGYISPGSAYRHQARIRKLSIDKQQKLLEKWLGPLASDVWQHIEARRGLREACEVPLLLSLLAFLVKDTDRRDAKAPHSEELPTTRLQLYDRGIWVLLQRGHGYGARRGVLNDRGARLVLGELSLRLLSLPNEGWTLDTLEQEVIKLTSETGSAACDYVGGRRSWRDAQAFLLDVRGSSGVLADLDGSGAPWRFVHRQFGELLAAEALSRKGQSAVLAESRRLRRKRERLPIWAEVLGFACELAERPLEVLKELYQANEELALRILPELERVSLVEALGVLKPSGDWDGDFLLRLFERWEAQGAFNPGDVSAWLWRQVEESRSTHELACFYYALEHLGEVDRERFFQQCDRWPKDGFPQPQWVRIEEGTFLMGSPETEPKRFVDEGPQHEVTLAAFELAPTAVTNAEYAQFDPSHEAEDFGGKVPAPELGQHPVVNVSWWAAYLYCRWLGGALPTEAQWEYACRAGTTTPFSFGDNITPAEVNYHGKIPYAGGKEGEFRACTVPVGSLPANRWGIHEMHGNVWEWCFDWFGGYELSVRAGDRLRQVERARGRVLRGGSWCLYARYCRSAYRFRVEPGIRRLYLGFRPARVIT